MNCNLVSLHDSNSITVCCVTCACRAMFLSLSLEKGSFKLLHTQLYASFLPSYNTCQVGSQVSEESKEIPSILDRLEQSADAVVVLERKVSNTLFSFCSAAASFFCASICSFLAF